MIRRNNELGAISVSNNVFTKIAGNAATHCFGVKGMAIRTVSDGLVHLLRRESMSKGVLIHTHDDGSVTIDLHIMVDKGVNIRAISASIIKEVRYFVTKSTGTEVSAVNVFVDSITID